ncbi:MAG: thiamine-phosphate kinase, partial [bacterium]|nr:thiamine-phosphate kinase [bacterium]
ILNGGEDYELLFTVRPDLSGRLLSQIAEQTKVKITEIGKIVPANQGFHLIVLNGQKQQIKPMGWDHFQQQS